MDKITLSHLQRKACIYVRQSTMEQVQNNLESQRLQYCLRDRARQLGWTEIEIIDADLGQSATGIADRIGFRQLISEICDGKVGAIFALEASRLARNNSEWHTLIEFCSIVNTLIIDPEGVYDPKLTNDRLLLGIKGTLSEMEVTLFRERSRAARREKAKRGELYTEIPIGYQKTSDGKLEKTPDKRVQQAIELAFNKFRQLGSMRQVAFWFQQEGIKLPAKSRGNDRFTAVWKIPSFATIRSLLTNPIYGGVYAYGRREAVVAIRNGKKHVTWQFRQKQEDWDVLIENHHEGYITWEEYQDNQHFIAQNANMKGAMVIGSVKKGQALLSGLLRCGYCGRKCHVSYRSNRDQTISYNCRNKLRTLETRCGSFTERRIALAVSTAVLDILSPLGIEAALKAAGQRDHNISQVRRQQELALDQARYECERIRRQYDAVEPENRIVASELERRWNEALSKVSQLETQLAKSSDTPSFLTEEKRKELLTLGHNLPIVWNHPQSSAELKKRILRIVIKEIVIYAKEEKIKILIHWQGGEHTELLVPKHRQYRKSNTNDIDIVALIRELARIMPDKDIANLFNRLGYSTAMGHTWTQARIYSRRYEYNIQAYRDGERQERGELNMSEASAEFNVHTRVLKEFINNGILPAKQACPHAPWIILRQDLEAVSSLLALTRLNNKSPSPLSKYQQPFNFSNLGKGAL